MPVKEYVAGIFLIHFKLKQRVRLVPGRAVHLTDDTPVTH